MVSAEKFCLRWNDFESNISGAFRELREDKDFFDVTLACDDDQLQAHKVILSACSPFFRTILRRNKHEHPLLYLKGVKYADLVSVLNFMYHGEVNVSQEELNSFLAVAEDLKVKGLTQNNSESPKSKSNVAAERPKPHVQKNLMMDNPKPIHKQPNAGSSAQVSRTVLPNIYQQEEDDIEEVVPIKSEPVPVLTDIPTNTFTAIVEQSYSNTSEVMMAEPNMEYEEEFVDYEGYEGVEGVYTDLGGQEGVKDFTTAINSVLFYDSTIRVWKCLDCQMTNKNKAMVRRHAEVHFKDFVHSCHYCGVQKKSSEALRMHIHAYHKDKKHPI